MGQNNKSWGEKQNEETMTNVVARLQDFMENEARSCSMDFGCVTTTYIYRMLGGSEETGGRIPVSVQLMVHELRLMVHG